MIYKTRLGIGVVTLMFVLACACGAPPRETSDPTGDTAEEYFGPPDYQPPWFKDMDGDGYGVFETRVTAEFAPGPKYVERSGDCDDNDPTIHPDVEEICDGIDNDCNNGIDEGFDSDWDGVTTCGGDCDDERFGYHPWMPEICDGIDNNCSGVADDGPDNDNDGIRACDCNDNNSAIGAEDTYGDNDTIFNSYYVLGDNASITIEATLAHPGDEDWFYLDAIDDIDLNPLSDDFVVWGGDRQRSPRHRAGDRALSMGSEAGPTTTVGQGIYYYGTNDNWSDGGDFDVRVRLVQGGGCDQIYRIYLFNTG